MEIIHKDAGDLKLAPNFTDYEQTRASFSWSEVPELCAGMGAGGCNIAYAAVDRHAAGPEAGRTAMRFIADTPGSAELVSHDVSYAELGRLTRKFTNAARARHRQGRPGVRDHGPGARALHQHARRAAQRQRGLAAVLRVRARADRNPRHDRSANVIVTTAAIYKRKIAKIRDQLTSVQHVLVVSDDDTEIPGTLNFHRLMDDAGDDARSSTPPPTTRRCCTSPAAPPEHPGAPSTCTARSPCTTPPDGMRSICTRATSIGAQQIPAGSPGPPTESSRRCCTGSPRSSTKRSSTPSGGTGSSRTSRSVSGTPHRRRSGC